ncbi:MAG: conjugal transfer protein TrbN [Limnobacter sp.]|jgi:hypothetical protein
MIFPPFVADLPPVVQERVVCAISASTKFQIPANILLGIAEKEGGKPGQWVRNSSNGSYDVGTMQFNTNYLKELSRYGITAEHVAAPGCYPYELAAWRIRGHLLRDKGDIWTRAANYHSRTPHFNEIYRTDLKRRSAKWAAWLRKHFVTLDMTKEGAKPQPPHAVASK